MAKPIPAVCGDSFTEFQNLFNTGPAWPKIPPGRRRQPGEPALSVTIYHNPNCSTSRKVLGLLRDAGHQPEVIEYLKTPPSRTRMKELLKDMGMKPRDILRRSGTPYDELGLDDKALTDEQILDALEKHPILMQRPVVVSPKGTRLCRPLEKVAEVVNVKL